MIGLYVVFLLVGIELSLLLLFKQIWIRAGIIASSILGTISFTVLAIRSVSNPGEYPMLDSFFILNMLLPILFSIELHTFYEQRKKKAKREIAAKKRK